MITIKLNNEVKVQKYLKHGIKIFINLDKEKRKWYILKLDKDKTDLLKFIISVICE